MRSLVAAYEQETGHHVRVALGSSGKLYAQVINGAPFDAFLSADQDKTERLEAAGYVVSGSRFTYAYGNLVLWSADAARTVDGPEALQSTSLRRLAIANPRLAPYGAATLEVLQSLGLAETLRDKWVMGENIAQSYQFASTGNAELGFVAASQVYRDGALTHGRGWRVPQSLHAPIKQDAVLLRRGRHNAAASGLLAYLDTDKARQLLAGFGYNGVPAATTDPLSPQASD